MRLVSTSASGTLYLVATPIGHRDDITLRAIDVLRSVDFILAEDTRHSSPLLTALGIQKPLLAFHAHNEALQATGLIERIKSGENAALISDAGTPLICDPGFPLVREARQQGVMVVPIPGACALITALSASGVACDRFTFVGFLPAKTQARRQELQRVLQLEHTLICYESTHRITACLEDLAIVYGQDGELVLAKELTKTFETFVSGTVATVQAWLQADKAHHKGEFVLIIPPRQQADDNTEASRCLDILLNELPLKQAVKLAALLTGVNKNALYALGLAKQQRE
jgi:16S rRNA (cytidine1402-2'-O)-methyltransferase